MRFTRGTFHLQNAPLAMAKPALTDAYNVLLAATALAGKKYVEHALKGQFLLLALHSAHLAPVCPMAFKHMRMSNKPSAGEVRFCTVVM
jgi:hypothetical protein